MKDSWFAADSAFPVREGCTVQALINGEEFFGALEVELESTSALFVALSFFQSSWTFPGGNFGNSWLAFLETLDRRGIQVFILAWNPEPNPIFPTEGIFGAYHLQELQEKVMPNVHIRWTDSAPDSQHCHHEKSFLCRHSNGKVVSLTGGIIPSPNWSRGGFMHDVGVRIEGNEDLYVSFVERWNAAKSKSETFQAANQISLADYPTLCSKKGTSSVQITRSLRPGLVSRNGEASILTLWKNLIRGARKTIYIEQQHLAHVELVSLIIVALKRGVKVIYVRPGRLEAISDETTTNLDVNKGRTRANYEKVFLEQMPQFETLGGVLCGLYDVNRCARIHVHSKLLIVDEIFVAVGSANLVDISMDLGNELHTEVCVGIKDENFAENFQQRLMDLHSTRENCKWDEFVETADSNASLITDNQMDKTRGTLYKMNAVSWGRFILPMAVSIFERARMME